MTQGTKANYFTIPPGEYITTAIHVTETTTSCVIGNCFKTESKTLEKGSLNLFIAIRTKAGSHLAAHILETRNCIKDFSNNTKFRCDLVQYLMIVFDVERMHF